MNTERRFALASALTVFDAASTAYAVGILGGRELNPLLLPVIDRLGIGGAMGARAIVGVAAAGWLAWVASHPRNRWGGRPLTFATVALGLLGCWHVGQYAWYYAG